MYAGLGLLEHLRAKLNFSRCQIHAQHDQRLRLILLLDCDGVLTDGGVILGTDGQEFKRFDIQDGMGVSMARRVGLKVGVITGRASDAVRKRAKELNLDALIEGAKDKVAALDEVLAEHGLNRSQAAYMGDDIQDLAILGACGLSLAPANARPEVRAAVGEATLEKLFLVGFWDPSSTRPAARRFVERFESRFGRTPRHDEAKYYDGVMLLATAVRDVGASRERVQAYLQDLGRGRPPYPGVTGDLAFHTEPPHNLVMRLGSTEAVVYRQAP